MKTILSKALSLFIETIRPYVVDMLKNYFPDKDWTEMYKNCLQEQARNQWDKMLIQNNSFDFDQKNLIDYGNLPSFAITYKEVIIKETGKKGEANSIINCLQELRDVRNKTNHYQEVDDDDADRALSNIMQVARIFEMQDLLEEIKKMKNGGNAVTPKLEEPVNTPQQQKTDNTALTQNDGRLTAWFNNAIPHYDIRNGLLDESTFAANLNDVAMGNGPEVYSNADMFFEKSYITAGMRDIAKRAISALDGRQTENRVISLQTGFGGGKTHTMIAVYHIARLGKRLSNIPVYRDILPNDDLPRYETANVAVFTNNTNDVSQGRTTDDGLTIHTLWGEIAYQLGGQDAYNMVRQNDVEYTAPSVTVFRPILEEHSPALILIDELADYCNKAASKTVGKSTLYHQTVSFMQTLTEAVSTVPRCILISSLPASATEVAASDIGQEILSSLETRIVRVGSSIKPVEDEEVFEVVRRRLFEEFRDTNAISIVANAYKTTYRNIKGELPEGSANQSYIDTIKKSYPFHPELIDIFRKRWGSDPRFQRTRGVLRLLAAIVQDLWNRRSSLQGSQALIHTSNVNLENLPTLTGTINSLMGSNWETVMQADVYGSSSNAYRIDNADPASNLCKYSLSQGVATTLLMASVGNQQNKGLGMKQIKLCVVRPQAFNHNDVDTAINKMEDVAHYLYASNTATGKQFWFHSKPNINILINQAKNDIKKEEMEAEILRRINNATSKSQLPLKILVNPSTDIPEQKSLTMVVLSPKYAVPIDSISKDAAQYIQAIATKKGNTDRIYRNTIFFLTCTEQGIATVYTKLTEYLACNKILTEYTSQLERDQQQDVMQRKEECGRAVDEAIKTAYTRIYKYSAKGNSTESIDIDSTNGDLGSYLGETVLKVLKENEIIIESIGQATLKNNGLWPMANAPVQVCHVLDSFLRYDDKPMIVGNSAVEKAVKRFCLDGLLKVSTRIDGEIKRLYYKEPIPFLDVTNEEYWLEDVSVVEPVTTNNAPTPSAEPIVNTQPTINAVNSPAPATGTVDTKTYNKIKIEGSVPIENWTSLFTSFINILKANNLRIEISLTANTTPQSPLTDNSQTFNSVKESAKQLGLKFMAEE